MERKKFIFIAASGVTTMMLPLGLYNCGSPKDDRAFAKPVLLSTIWDIQTTAEIGGLYRKQYPNEDTEQKLIGMLS